MSRSHKPERVRQRFSAVDRHVAQRIRMRRQALGMTQYQLAELIGVVSQQVQRYERGASRITAGKLHAIALALGTDVAFFFERTDPEPVVAGQQDSRRRFVELIHNVQRIGSPGHRQAVCLVAKALASLGDQQPAEPA